MILNTDLASGGSVIKGAYPVLFYLRYVIIENHKYLCDYLCCVMSGPNTQHFGLLHHLVFFHQHFLVVRLQLEKGLLDPHQLHWKKWSVKTLGRKSVQSSTNPTPTSILLPDPHFFPWEQKKHHQLGLPGFVLANSIGFTSNSVVYCIYCIIGTFQLGYCQKLLYFLMTWQNLDGTSY